MDYSFKSTAQLTKDLEVLNQLEGSIKRQRLESIAELERRRVWRADGAKDMAQWVAARCDESHWRSRRWVDAAPALANLPQIRRALAYGTLSLDKVCELTRFATRETERGLIRWAKGVSLATVRRKADRATVDPIAEVRAEHDCRSPQWWYEDDKRLRLEAILPPEQGATVVRALERLAERLPSDPDIERAFTVDARRADALVALCSQAIADDPDSARARVNLHIDLEALSARSGSGELDSGGSCIPQSPPSCAATPPCRRSSTARGATSWASGGRRATCHRGAGSAGPQDGWLMRQLEQRDRGCTFPGCHQKRYLVAHHIWWWGWGGPTNLDNLTLVCPSHHDLIHLRGWRVELGKTAGVTYWFRPDNRLYEPNRAPPGHDYGSTIEQRALVGN